MTSETFDKDLPVGEGDVTTPFSSEPHFIRFSVKKRGPDGNIQVTEDGKEVEVACWARKYPTRDAASSVGEDVNVEIKHMRGEPEQAWSEVGRVSGCPNPAVLATHRNISWTLHQAQAHKPEVLPHDHPAYANSFRRRQDILDAGGDPDKPAGSSGDPAGSPASGSPGKTSSRTKRPGPKKVRTGPSGHKAPVPPGRGTRKASKSKKVKGPAE